MSMERFRFLLAGGLRLGVPLHGLEPVPDHLHDLCLQAPYRAAERVFDLALNHDVQFVVLAGDIINPRHAGPRAVSFLLQQLTRLQAANIDVYWCGGAEDHFPSWPALVPLPTNVHVFPAGRVGSWTVRCHDTALATIQGRSSSHRDPIRAADFSGDRSRFSIAVAYGSCDDLVSHTSDIDFWALGGHDSTDPTATHDRQYPTSSTTRPAVQYAGTCQGRSGDEPGARGAFVVEVENDALLRLDFHPTDLVRWHTEHVALSADLTSSGLQRLLRQRIGQLKNADPDRWVFVQWILSDADPSTDTRSDQLAAHLRQGGLAAELTSQLRSDFGSSNPGVWTVDLRAETPARFPSGWYEEDTVLGDLLRAVQQYQRDATLRVELEEHEFNPGFSQELIDALRISSDENRATVLRKVAALGVDLLRGDRVLSEELATLVDWAQSDSTS